MVIKDNLEIRLYQLSIFIIFIYMQSIFAVKQIVWAKVKGYPWWPAEVYQILNQIAKLPTSDHNVFKVVFIAEDTHAFLNPRDVRKYSEFYDECSKKKMRGLTPAIQTADQMYKKRTQSNPKSRSPQKGKARCSTKSKAIKKSVTRTNANRQRSEDDQQLELISEQQISQPVMKNNLTKQKQPIKQEKVQSQRCEDSQHSSLEEGSMQEQKFMNESEQKVDRSKIESIEETIYRFIEEIKQGSYKFSIEHYKAIALCNLTDEELLQSKLTNMLSYIISSLNDLFKQSPKEKQEFNQLIILQKQLKERIIAYLNDTSYYDQYLKLIQRNKKNRNQYENRLIYYLKNTYKVKKELCLIFASRLMAQINNGALVKQKQLLEDIKQHKVEIGVINNKAAIDRNIEIIIPKYM